MQIGRNEENDDFGMCTNDVVLFLKHACGVEGCVRSRENVYRAECAEFTQVASVPTSLVADTSEKLPAVHLPSLLRRSRSQFNRGFSLNTSGGPVCTRLTVSVDLNLRCHPSAHASHPKNVRRHSAELID